MWIRRTEVILPEPDTLWKKDRVAVTIVFDSYEVCELREEHFQKLLRLLFKCFESVRVGARRQ